MRISVDGSRIRNNKVAFSNLSGIVWMGPETTTTAPAVSKTPVVTRPGPEPPDYLHDTKTLFNKRLNFDLLKLLLRDIEPFVHTVV